MSDPKKTMEAMKTKRFQYTAALLLILLSMMPGYAQTTISGNWTLERTYTSSNGNSYYDDITFYDGLGYAEQIVQVGASANTGKNIVTPVYYDLMRRSDARVYLPYVTTVSTRTEVSMSSVFTNQATWYNNNGYSGQGAYAFSQKNYDASPLNRVSATYKPGSTHAEASGDRPVEYAYAANAASEVKKLTISFSTQNLSISGYWPAGTFIKTTVTDEDGRTVIKFSDLDGRTHLTRVMNGTTAMDTYTIYDVYGNVGWVVTPEGSALIPSSGTWTVPTSTDVNTSNAAKYCYVYTYDGQGRCQTRKFPGKALEELVYDNVGRLTMSRDGEQRSAGKWITYKYDVQGHLLERRLLSSTQSRSYYQNLFFNLNPSAAYSSSATLLEENVYGSYSSATGLGFSAVTGVTVIPDTGRVTGLLTYTRTAVMDGSTVSGYIQRAYYYDTLGRLIQTVESDPDGVLSRYSIAYDFVGNVIAESETHGSDTKTAQYTYDARGRLLSESSSVNGGTVAVLEYSYDDLGNLTGTSYGPASSPSTRVTQTDTRNILGWLTSRTATLGTGSTNVFTMSLDYWNPTPSSVATGLYGGDVTAWHWKQGSNTQMAYVLSYDSTGRLTDSRTVSGSGTTATAAWSERSMTYDRNGNLKTLSRYGSSSSPSQNLSYTYTGNRRSGHAYDSDGRVTTDGAGGVTRSYGILGNPYQTKTGSTVNAQYTYASDGTRVKAVNGSGTGYVYRGSFVYSTTGSSDVLESVGFGGGRIEKNGTGYDVAYHITDHLGSVRSIVKNGSIVEQNDYYPYGGRHANSTLAVQTSPVPNRWRFSGKEDLSAALGDPVLDFGARMYSSAGVMWTTPDPMAEKYYNVNPYTYCGSNPVNIIDPHGDTTFVLIAFHGAAGFGHIAIATQNKDGIYQLFSKNGYDEGGQMATKSLIGRLGGSESDRGTTIEEGIMSFLMSPSNNSVKTDHSDYPYYSEAYMIPTSQEQDLLIIGSALEAISRPYSFLSDNCAHTVIQSLSSAGVLTISSHLPSQIVGSTMNLYMRSSIPRLLYQEIKHNNPGGLTISPNHR